MDYEIFAGKVAKNIKRIRISRNLSQEDVAGIEMSLRTYQRIENGNFTPNPNLKTIFYIAKALNVSPRELLDI